MFTFTDVQQEINTKRSSSHPEDLPADVGDPLLLQRVPFGVFDQVRHRAGAAELHHQLHRQTGIELVSMTLY